MKDKLEELCMYLLGPILDDPSVSWKPKVAGLDKRELLKEILTTIGLKKIFYLFWYLKKLGKQREVQRITTKYTEALEELNKVENAPTS